MVGIGGYRHESPAASHFSITLMIVTVLLWIVFFIADDMARKRIDGEGNTAVVVDLLTLTGTFLAGNLTVENRRFRSEPGHWLNGDCFNTYPGRFGIHRTRGAITT